MNKFSITITCNLCRSQDVLADLWMSQGTGLLHVECKNCDNKTDASYDTEDLQKELDR